MDVKKLIKGGVYGTGAGLAGFLTGMGIQAIAMAAGLTAVAAVPVTAITPLFAFLSSVLGFGAGILEEEQKQ